jgi:hypothetical protein
MKNILRNKKKLVISLAICGLFITISLSSVTADPPGDKPPKDKVDDPIPFGYDTTPDSWNMTLCGNISTLDNVTIGSQLFPISDTKLYVTADNVDQNAIVGYSSESGRSGVSGIGSNGNGVFGISYWGIGVNGRSNEGTAIYGWTDTGLAGNFQGDVNINGNLDISENVTIGTDTFSGTKLYVNTESDQYAIFGNMTKHAGFDTYGVVGKNVYGPGIWGYSTHTKGIKGESLHNTGIYGTSLHGLAGEFDGHVEVNGDLTVGENISWSPKTSYINISSSAFRPEENNYVYRITGSVLQNYNSASDIYYADVQLPHGATFKSMSFTCSDWDDLNNSEVTFYRQRLNGMVSVVTAQSSGHSGLADSYISYDSFTIDNSQYAYFLKLDVPTVKFYIHSVCIGYTIEEPY